MPVYEFYCRMCHVQLAFFSRRIDTVTQPACPHCQGAQLTRQMSVVNVVKNKSASVDCATADDPALRQIGDRLSMLSESDSKTTAELTTALFEKAGVTPGEAMQTALSRLHAGEEPVSIENDLAADIDAECQVQSSADSGARGIQASANDRREGEPFIDPVLYDLLPEVE